MRIEFFFASHLLLHCFLPSGCFMLPRSLLFERFDAPQRCPEWNEWQSWGSCSVLCNGGVQARARTCTTDDNSIACSGSPVEQRSCNMHVCAAL